MEPNLKLIKGINDPPSPKMKHCFTKLTGKTLEPDIRVKGGAGLAIATVQLALNATRESGKEIDVGKIVLPIECFCAEWSDKTGRALTSTLVDAKYNKGYTVWRLSETEVQVKRGTRKLSKSKHIEVANIKRPLISLESPKLPEISQVRRSWGGK